MLRKTVRCTAPALLLGLLAGCSLFSPRPVLPERPTHVILIGMDGITEVRPDHTPHLALLLRYGACSRKMQSTRPGGRTAIYREALTGMAVVSPAELAGQSVFARCRDAGLRTAAIVRSPELAAFDPHAIQLKKASPSLDNPATAGDRAAAEFLRTRPHCLFVELSTGQDAPRACDAGLGRVLAAVRQAGAEDRTTVLVMAAGTTHSLWAISGPDTRLGRQLSGSVAASDTFAVVCRLLGLSGRPGRPLSEPAAAAFRTDTAQPPSAGERRLPRGALWGRVLDPNGRPMAKASVLLVKTEPLDGITERWADTDQLGEFRFVSIPAGSYDDVFVFDNIPSRLRRSVLVRRDLAVNTTKPKRVELRCPSPAVDGGLFLEDDHVAELVNAVRSGRTVWGKETGPPLLAADALAGRRVRTPLIRDWLLSAAKTLESKLGKGQMDDSIVALTIDLATAYDLNRASGLFSAAEEKTLRNAMRIAGKLLIVGHEEKKLSRDAETHLALALLSGALRPSPLSSSWLKRADRMYEARFQTVSADAERAPASIDLAELNSLLQYAAVNRALGCGNYVNKDLARLVRLASSCLTPEQRRVHPARRSAAPDPRLSFLGLAKTLFAGHPFGHTMQALWETCGSPYWRPRGGESVLGPLLIAASDVSPHKLAAEPSTKLTETAAVLRRDWGSPSEWMICVNGWDIDVHLRGAPLARASTAPSNGQARTTPKLLAYQSCAAYDYALLGARISTSTSGSSKGRPAYRHVLFNKLTGYLAVSDELPDGAVTSTRLLAADARSGVITGPQGAKAQLLAVDVAVEYRGKTAHLRSTSATPAFVICPPPPGARAGSAALATWQAERLDPAAGPGLREAHLLLSAHRGPEFIRFSRAQAQVVDNEENYMLDASVGLLRPPSKTTASADLMVIRAERSRWAQCDRAYVRFESGSGYLTVDQAAGTLTGWSDGRYARKVTLWPGPRAPGRRRLQVDGSHQRLSVLDKDRAALWLPRGPHRFRISR